MKAGYIKIIGWLLFCSIALLGGSCIGDDDDDGCEGKTGHYRLTVKTIDPDSENIKENVSLYVFDHTHQLIKVVKCDIDLEADIELEPSEQYSIVALGHSPETPAPAITLGISMKDAQIILPTSDFASHTVATSPGDIFYGRIDIKNNDKNVRETVWIKRKVAALAIITHNIQSQLNTTDVDFSYVVRQTNGTLDFEGKLKGEKVAYHPESYINSTNHDLVAPMFYTFALEEEDGFCIDIYKGAALIKTYCTDKEEQKMMLKEGKRTVVYIDFNNTATDGFLDITCILKDWTDDDINEGFN